MPDNLENVIEENKTPDIQEKIGSALNEQELEKVEIHTMPKRFLNSRDSGSKSAKSVGILILAGGGIILLAGIGFLYFYITKPPVNPDTDVINIPDLKENMVDNTEEVKEAKKEEAEEEITEETKESEETEIIENENTDDNATATIPVIITASSSKATSSNISENATSTEAENNTEATSTSAALKIAIDSDSDGLTDIEEVLLDSNPESFDSDADGYTDISELKNLYNPAGGGSLAANPNISRYTNSKYNYVLYYPNTWLVQTGAGDESIVFKISGDEFVQVIVEPDALAGSLEVWYRNQFEDSGFNDILYFEKKGWSGIRHADSKIIYLKKDGSSDIYTMTYNISPDGIVRYQEIFEMMVRSLDLK